MFHLLRQYCLSCEVSLGLLIFHSILGHLSWGLGPSIHRWRRRHFLLFYIASLHDLEKRLFLLAFLEVVEMHTLPSLEIKTIRLI